jgi:hypothetical protein
MIASTLNYIESDFTDSAETAREYRARVATTAQGHRVRRAYRRLRRRA